MQRKSATSNPSLLTSAGGDCAERVQAPSSGADTIAESDTVSLVFFGADHADAGIQAQPVEAWVHQPTDLMASYNEDGDVYHGTGAALMDVYRTEVEWDSDSEEILAFANCMLGPGGASYFG